MLLETITKPNRYAPHPAITCAFLSYCRWDLLPNRCFTVAGISPLLGMLQRVDVFVSYSHCQYNRFNAVKTARVASLSALKSLSFPHPVLSYEFVGLGVLSGSL